VCVCVYTIRVCMWCILVYIGYRGAHVALVHRERWEWLEKGRGGRRRRESGCKEGKRDLVRRVSSDERCKDGADEKESSVGGEGRERERQVPGGWLESNRVQVDARTHAFARARTHAHQQSNPTC